MSTAAALFSHAEAVARPLVEAVDIPRGEAYYLTQTLKPDTPIYSLVMKNTTGVALRVTVSSSTSRLLAGNLSKGGTVPARGEMLLFTNDPKGNFTLGLATIQIPSLSGSFAFHADEGKETTIKAGYKFPALDHWKNNTSAAHSNPFSVVIEGTSPDRMLNVVSG